MTVTCLWVSVWALIHSRSHGTDIRHSHMHVVPVQECFKPWRYSRTQITTLVLWHYQTVQLPGCLNRMLVLPFMQTNEEFRKSNDISNTVIDLSICVLIPRVHLYNTIDADRDDSWGYRKQQNHDSYNKMHNICRTLTIPETLARYTRWKYCAGFTWLPCFIWLLASSPCHWKLQWWLVFPFWWRYLHKQLHATAFWVIQCNGKLLPQKIAVNSRGAWIILVSMVLKPTNLHSKSAVRKHKRALILGQMGWGAVVWVCYQQVWYV